MSDPKNLIEALELLKQAGAQAKAILADGKVDVRDLPKLITLWTPAKAALEDANQIAGEVAGLDTEGAQKVISKVVEVVEAWMSVLSTAA